MANKNFVVKNGVTVGDTEVIDSSSEIVTSQLKDSGVTAGTYGDSSSIPVLAVDEKGRVTSAGVEAVKTSEYIEFEASNASGATIPKGAPVYIIGHSGNDPEIGIADANDPAKMPAFGIAKEAITSNSKGQIVIFGDYRGIDTSAFSAGDELYVSSSGTLINTRPSGSDEKVQKIAKVIRPHAVNGQLFVMGAGRSNDIPNLPHGEVFIGNNAGWEARALDTDDVSEGTNLYYTDTRAVTAIKADSAWNASNWDTAYGWGDHSSENYAVTTGDTFTGNLSFNDDISINMGTDKLKMYYDSNTGFSTIEHADANNGLLLAKTRAFYVNNGTRTSISAFPGLGVSLFYDDTKRLEVVSDGVNITGILDANSVEVSGGNSTNWNTAYGWGDHGDEGYLTTVSFSDLTGKPTTIAGYGITDAFDGAYGSLTGAPTNVSSFTNDSGYITDYTVTQGDVTAHQAALSITESQISDFGSYLTSETTTSLSASGNILTYTDEEGNSNNIDLSLYLDDTNAARITSGTMNSSGIATFTRDDATTFTVDMSVLLDDTNLSRITSAAWNTSNGVLTLTRNDATTITVDLDDRYLTSHQDISGKANKSGDTFTGKVTIDRANGWDSNANGSNLLRLDGADGYPSLSFFSDGTANWTLYKGGNGSWVGDGSIGFLHHSGNEDSNRVKFKIDTSGNITALGTVTATGGNSTNWNEAHGWGNHADVGYLTSHQDISGKANKSGDTFTGRVYIDSTTNDKFVLRGSNSPSVEFQNDADAFRGRVTVSELNKEIRLVGQDPDNVQGIHILGLGQNGLRYSPNNGLTQYNVWHSGDFSSTKISNWDTAYGWGNHASAGYLTSLPSHNHDDRYYTESEADTRFANITGDTFTGNLQVNGGYLEAYGQFYLRDDLNFINAGVNGWHKIIEKNGGNPYFNAIDSYRVGGTTVIDSARNASFVNGSFVGNLDVITGGSSGQIRVGRTSDQNLLINVNDRVALLEHRQDEGTGEHIMQFNINSPTDLANKSFDFTNGNIKVGGTTVIDSSRNLTNIQSLSLSGSDGAIKQSTDTNKNLIIGSANTALRFINNSGQRRIIPRDLDDTAENGTIDLGDSGSKFRDIYLSTGVVIGSTRVIDSSRNLTNIGNITATGQLNLNRGADDALFIDTTVADNTTRPAIKLYENDSQASGRQSIQWFNGNLNYIKAEMWTQVGASFNATRFGIDVADNSRSVSTRLYIENGNTYITGVLNTGTISSTGNHTMSGDSYTLYGGNSTWGAYLQVGGNSRQYVNDSNVASVVTSNGNLHLDASSGRDLYLNFYDGSNVYFGSGANGTVGIVDNAGKATFSSYTIGGTTVIDSARNLTNMGAGSFSSYVSMNELRANSYMLQDGVKEIALGTFNFSNSDPNNFIDIIFTAGSFWGTVEVEITSSYSYQNACGSLVKRFAVGHNSSYSYYGGGSEELISDTGLLSNSIRIGSITRKGTTFVVPINKFTSTNNNFEVRVKLFSIGYSGSTTVTLGSKYSGTNLAREYVPFRHITGQASNTVISSTIDSTGRLRVSGGNNSDGNAQTSTGAVIGTYVDQYAFIDLASSHANGSWIDFSYADGGDYKGRIRYVNSTGIFEFHANGSSSANMSLGTSYMEMYGGIRADEYRINSTTVIDSSRNAIGFVDIKGSGSYHEFGNAIGSVSNDGNWNARLNLAGSSHAKLDVKSVSDGIITSIYSHTGQNRGFVGTLSNHKLGLAANGTAHWYIETDGKLRHNDVSTAGMGDGGIRAKGAIDSADVSIGAFRVYDGSTFRGGFGTSRWALGSGYDVDDMCMYSVGDKAHIATDDGSIRARITASGISMLTGGYEIDGTTVIDSSRNMYPNVIDMGSGYAQGYKFHGRSFSWNSAMQSPTSNMPHIWQEDWNGWDPVIGVKTQNGFWQMGAYTNDYFHIGYMSGAYGTHSSNGFDKSIAITPSQLRVGDVGTMSIVASGNITAYSDARLKDNVETLDGSKVYEMRGVSFTKDGELGSGVIAQELEQVAPELVMTNDDEMQTKSVAYGNVVGYLIEAIKDQNQKIEQLEKLVQQLLEK